MPEPTKHHALVGDLLPAVGHADSEESGMRLGRQAVHRLADWHAEPIVVHSRCGRLSLHGLAHRQLFCNGAEPCEMQRRAHQCGHRAACTPTITRRTHNEREASTHVVCASGTLLLCVQQCQLA
eukprot:3649849-Prymnesium_polylepis.2